jgi:hypothetical protein
MTFLPIDQDYAICVVDCHLLRIRFLRLAAMVLVGSYDPHQDLSGTDQQIKQGWKCIEKDY